ncbi:HlyD family secretion protein [Enterobacteriaceae bacterium BIT-l23]|nr:HlyD family secretion protein [Enterobacteriaceae bacterium BIT-l23]
MYEDDMSNPGIFRLQVINRQKAEWRGRALLTNGLPPWLIALLSILFMALLLYFLFFFDYTRRIEVSGEVITFPHAINIYSPQQGYISKVFVKQGDSVKSGDPIYSINVSRQTTSGNVSAETLTVLKKQIANIDQIIEKLSSNKKETLSNLQEQLTNYQQNHDKTTRLITSVKDGVAKMREGMTSYEGYRKRGLITTDQLNNQRFMFYQQQSNLQSLNSQAIQETLQISQLRSQILTRAAEFDNNITQNIYQRNELQRKLIESDAGATIIIFSQGAGRVESLSVTPGQMVNSGSSLAQIQPQEKTHYYMVLWIPDSSLPYVKIKDTVNIRYSAFPSEKFGQFPGVIKSIAYIPASREEMTGYGSAPKESAGSASNYYKVLVDLKDTDISDKGQKMHLSGGLQAKTIVFLDTRKLYQWMFMPFYEVKHSVTGRVANE